MPGSYCYLCEGLLQKNIQHGMLIYDEEWQLHTWHLFSSWLCKFFQKKFHLEALEAQPEALEALEAQKLLYMVLEALEVLQPWAWLHD